MGFGNLLKNPKLRLLRAMNILTVNDTFDDGTGDWVISSDWHKMTVESNVDKSMGIDGTLAINCMGSYSGGTCTKTVTLKEYSEVAFEYYVQDDKVEGNNWLKFYIDDVLKLEAHSCTPWTRIEPIGLTPGEHTFKFEYNNGGSANGKKGVFNTFQVWEARPVDCVVKSQTPPKPDGSISSSKTLRGYSSHQEMTRLDTICKFTCLFDGIEYHDFTVHSDEIHYYIDEFGTCYRGMISNGFSPKNIALNKVYIVDIELKASSKCGVGFC